MIHHSPAGCATSTTRPASVTGNAAAPPGPDKPGAITTAAADSLGRWKTLAPAALTAFVQWLGRLLAARSFAIERLARDEQRERRGVSAGRPISGAEAAVPPRAFIYDNAPVLPRSY
jgi:hypothetical protein